MVETGHRPLKKRPTEATLLLSLELGDLARQLPKLDVPVVHQFPCSVSRRIVVGANEIVSPFDAPVVADHIGFVVRHDGLTSAAASRPNGPMRRYGLRCRRFAPA